MGGRLTASLLRMPWALDLDGVIWRGTDTVPGSPEAVACLRAAELPLAFVTNSALRTPAEVAANLAHHGIPDSEPEVITSAMAAATMVEPGERVLVVGSHGLFEALSQRGAAVAPAEGTSRFRIGTDSSFDAVVVGITFSFNYEQLAAALRAIQGGARFIATNLDSVFPVADGVVPGNGALVAALRTASGVVPEVAGKPAEPIAALVRERLGNDGIMVGDRSDTDGRFAARLGYRFGLVLSGATSPDMAGPEPWATKADLRSLVGDVLSKPE